MPVTKKTGENDKLYKEKGKWKRKRVVQSERKATRGP